MRGFHDTYAGRIRFSVLEAQTDEGRAARDRYGWEESQHGLVALNSDGTYVGDLPGHNYGADEITQLIDKLLAAATK